MHVRGENAHVTFHAMLMLGHPEAEKLITIPVHNVSVTRYSPCPAGKSSLLVTVYDCNAVATHWESRTTRIPHKQQKKLLGELFKNVKAYLGLLLNCCWNLRLHPVTCIASSKARSTRSLLPGASLFVPVHTFTLQGGLYRTCGSPPTLLWCSTFLRRVQFLLLPALLQTSSCAAISLFWYVITSLHLLCPQLPLFCTITFWHFTPCALGTEISKAFILKCQITS